MNRNSKKLMALVISATIFSAPLIGCTTNTTDTTNKTTENTNKTTETNDNTADSKTVEEAERSKTVREKLSTVPGVKDASTVVHDNTAVVGIVYNDDVSSKEDVNKAVEDAVKQTDTKITTVKISDDTSMTDKIKKMYDDLASGKTWDDVKDQFENFKNDIGM